MTAPRPRHAQAQPAPPPADADTVRAELTATAQRRRAVEAEAAAATAQLAQLITQARQLNVGVTEIAERTGLTRQAVYNLAGWASGARTSRH